jgi:hypothetical protein
LFLCLDQCLIGLAQEMTASTRAVAHCVCTAGGKTGSRDRVRGGVKPSKPMPPAEGDQDGVTIGMKL